MTGPLEIIGDDAPACENGVCENGMHENGAREVSATQPPETDR